MKLRSIRTFIGRYSTSSSSSIKRMIGCCLRWWAPARPSRACFRRYVRARWCLVACPRCGAAPGTACTEVDQKRGTRPPIPVHDERRQLATENGFGSVGWHTFRHSYRLGSAAARPGRKRNGRARAPISMGRVSVGIPVNGCGGRI
jgi:hypothetical protein